MRPQRIIALSIPNPTTGQAGQLQLVNDLRKLGCFTYQPISSPGSADTYLKFRCNGLTCEMGTVLQHDSLKAPIPEGCFLVAEISFDIFDSGASTNEYYAVVHFYTDGTARILHADGHQREREATWAEGVRVLLEELARCVYVMPRGDQERILAVTALLSTHPNCEVSIVSEQCPDCRGGPIEGCTRCDGSGWLTPGKTLAQT